MSFHDDESSDLGLAGQTKLESFLFSKKPLCFPLHLYTSVSAHVGVTCKASLTFLIEMKMNLDLFNFKFSDVRV